MKSTAYSTPHFIELLIADAVLMEDGELEVSGRPHVITTPEILSSLILKDRRFRLPVVYVSRTKEHALPVDCEALAKRVRGMAHVIVQGESLSDREIREACNSKNEFYGAIGIYYPNSQFSYRRYLYHGESGPDAELLEKVISHVIRYGNVQFTDPLYTWQGVNNALLRNRLEAQREEVKAANAAAEKNSLDTDRLLDSFEDDMKKLEEKVRELTITNERLEYENMGLKSRLDMVGAAPVLHTGEEPELYPGEIKDLLLTALSDALKGRGIVPDSRREDVVRDIIEHNDFEELCSRNAGEISRLLGNYTDLTGPLKQDLRDLGFEISDDGKHYKAVYHQDGRYTFTIPKTPSDRRGVKHLVSDITGKVF